MHSAPTWPQTAEVFSQDEVNDPEMELTRPFRDARRFPSTRN
jgi:hypothetical protein